MSDAHPFSSPFPEQMRAFAESSVAQAKDGYARLKQTAESNNDAIEAARQSAAKGVSEYAAKVLDVTKTNTEAAFDLAHDLAGATSPAVAATLWTSFAQRQFEALTAQTQEISSLSQRIVRQATEPMTSVAANLFKPAR